MMTNEYTQNEMNKALFTSLVMMLSSSAMQQLGKLVNPLTNKTEVNLEGAQVTIDMLAMLQEKTKGNLDKNEEKMLKDILSSLQMNYVEMSKKAPSQPEKKEKQTTDDRGQSARDDSDRPGTADDSGNGKDQRPKEKVKDKREDKEKKDHKFHKSYG